MNATNRYIETIRTYLSKSNLDAVIIPSNDPHQSEYVSDNWKLRAHFSGFTGSAGTLVITQSLAALWTDSRYFLQVEKECSDSEVQLYKQSIPHAPEHVPWLCESLDENSRIGIDFRLFSCSQMEHLKTCGSLKNIEVVNTGNAICELWENRPDGPSSPIVDHPKAHAGQSRLEKIELIRNHISEKHVDGAFYTKLDEISWLFNIRSKDVDFTPLVTSYALITRDQSYLFTDVNRVEDALTKQLEADNVTLLSYEGYEGLLAELTDDQITLVDPSSINYASFHAIQGPIVNKSSIIIHLKSIKNETEIENCKEAMIRDGVAMTNFFYWLHQHLETEQISEYEIGRKLESFRKAQDRYVGESFAAIVGYQGNGAIIHYTAPEHGSAMVQNAGILLVDSGAQYLDATTDITRTVWLGGDIDPEIKTCFTAVLKGYISLETLIFPEGTTGIQIDTLARMHLWELGYRYGHGTGHGVGSYGPVHEAPQGFANNGTTSRGTAGHQSGQLSSIEPGCYVEGKFGIRTENIVLSTRSHTTDFGQFLGFEPVTLCYIDTELLDVQSMTSKEIDWLNAYHEKVYTKLSPHLSDEVGNWLKEKCRAIAP